MSAYPIDDEAIDFINQQLEAIAQSVSSVFSASLDVYLDHSSFSDGPEKVNELITTLSSMLVTCGSDYEFLSVATGLEEISKGLENNLEYYISSDVPNRQYDVLVALITELQSNILDGSIPNAPETEESAMDVDEPASNDMVPIDMDTNGRIAVQLDKLCRLLKIDSSSANDSADVIALVQASIEDLVKKHPKPEQILHPETILPATTVLTDAQKATQQHLEEALQQDFTIRRQMMLTRFEVTLESLLGEDEEGAAIDDETARVRAAVKAQLKSIRRQPFLYRWEDALTAPVAIFYEQAKKVTGEAYTSAGSVVKKVVVGPVPDRGGRVNDLRQKKFYEGKSWGGGGGGRGNFQKGRGGGGGGGNDKGAKNDSKGNGNKNNSNSGNNNNNNSNSKDGGNNNKQQNNNGGGSTANASGRVVTVTKEGEGSKGGADEHQRKKGRR